MTTYNLIVLPFQLVASVLLLRFFRPRMTRTKFILVAGSLGLDSVSLLWQPLFPLSSCVIIVTLLLYYGRDWTSVIYVLAANAAMFVIYSKVPMGAYFVTAINYYVAYNIKQRLTVNEIYLKNALYYASMKHLSLTAGYWFAAPATFELIADCLSVIVSYYLLRASLYYFTKGKENDAAQKAAQAE